jgi:tyrosine-protein phosphatase non-receptor type 23
VATVKRYYSQLHSLQNRFPLSDHELLDFAWKDIYSGSLSRTGSIKYEMASILYNIACLHSQLGIEENRSDPESMKIACTHFQCAAWSFNEVKERYPSELRGDLTAELLIFMQWICFAQAQECILEKSLADNRKPAIIAKVVAQVISFYNDALVAISMQSDDGSVQDMIGSKLHKEWLRYIKFKTSYLSSILFLYQGMNSEEQRKMGERIALYNAACDKLEEAKKESKGMNKIEVINEALTFATDIIEGKRKNAKQENEFIYHESIPDISTISAVQGANLVQGIGFDVADPQVIGDDIFKRLVPMKTHEHLSVYSEEKANILRALGAKIDDHDAVLSSFMGSLNTESLNAMGTSQERLPQAIVDRCAELSAKPKAIPDLVDSMSNLADICCDVEVTLKDIKRILDDEATQEREFQKQMGKRPTGHMAELNREFTKYFEAHNKAGESNDTLRKAMELHVNNLKILAQPLSTLKTQVPQADAIDEKTRKELTVLLNKVEEMKMQRDGLYNELRDQILNKDDITAQLITHGEKDVEELFKKELKKYSQNVQIIEQNLVAQENILKALTETYAKHAMTLKSYNDAKQRREQFYSSLVASFDVYEDLMSKSAKGLDFYKKLHGNVQKLMSRTKAARDVQEEERQQLLKNVLPKNPPATKTVVDSSYKPNPTPSSGGPKLKDYLKSGMVPGMGGDLSKLPAVRPSPVGQENISSLNPASCTSMAYRPYIQSTGVDQYPQQTFYQDSGSHSSSSTSLNSDLYYQSGTGGYMNPIYQQMRTQNNNSYQQPAQAQVPTSVYQQQQPKPQQMPYQYDYYNTNSPKVDQNSYLNQQQTFDNSQNFNQTQYQVPQAPPSYQDVTQNQQNYPIAQSPSLSQNQGGFSYGNQVQMPQQQQQVQMPINQAQQQHQQQQIPSQMPSNQAQIPPQQQQIPYTPTPAYSPSPAYSPAPEMTNNIPQQSMTSSQDYSMMNSQNFQQNQQNYGQQKTQIAGQNNQIVNNQIVGHQNIQNQSQVADQNMQNQNFYSYNTQQQPYMMNQYGQFDNQQNYSCYTPTINTVNSYMQSGDNQASQSQTTQSANYTQIQEIVSHSKGQIQNVSVPDSPLRTPNAIPTYTAAVNSSSLNSSETVSTNSQQQISSSVQIKSSNIDLLSDIDFSVSSPTIDHIPTLKPISMAEEKVLTPQKTVLAAPVVLNTDLAELDFDSLSVTAPAMTAKPIETEQQKNVNEKFDENVLKQFHKEVENLEKFIETLTVRTLNGVTPLANKWKELQDLLVKDESKRSVSIARLFPDKNRSIDCLPYDHARVLLPTATDNYINAVLVKDCGPIPFILTQTPMANTVKDYWEMILTQKPKILVCLHSSSEVKFQFLVELPTYRFLPEISGFSSFIFKFPVFS